MKHAMTWFLTILTLFNVIAIADTIILPSSLTVIEKETFEGDISLDKVVLGDNVNEIESRAFAGSSVSSINLPESIQKISDDAFDGVEKLNVEATEGTYAYNWALEMGYIQQPMIEYPESDHPYAAHTNLVWEYVHPTSAEALAITFSEDTFFEARCDYLIITDSTGESQKYTGGNLSDMTLKLPGNSFTIQLTSDNSIQKYGFRIVQIESISMQEYEQWYDDAINRVFLTKPLENGTLTITGYQSDNPIVIVPSEINGIPVSTIGAEAFFFRDDLVSITISEGILAIEDAAFEGCLSLMEVSIPTSVAFISPMAFHPMLEDCNIIAEENSYAYSWALENGLKVNGMYATPITDFIIENGVIKKYIGSSSRITIPNQDSDGNPITAIGDYAFDKNYDITDIIISEGIKEIGVAAFQWCEYLQSIYIPDSVVSIQRYAFNDCIRLRTVNIPNGLETIPDSMFVQCERLTNITIPESVTRIEGGAFQCCRKLESITIPDSVTYIGIFAFDGCNSLKSISFGRGITSIPIYAFDYCRSLIYIEIPDSITSIDNEAFKYCTNLEGIYLPDSVINFGKDIFQGCEKITIYGANGSASEEYANKYGIPFVGSPEITYLEIGKETPLFINNTIKYFTPYDAIFEPLKAKDGVEVHYALQKCSSIDGEYEDVSDDPSPCYLFYPTIYNEKYCTLSKLLIVEEQTYFRIHETIIFSDGKSLDLYSIPCPSYLPYENITPKLRVEGIGPSTVKITVSDCGDDYTYALASKGGIIFDTMQWNRNTENSAVNPVNIMFIMSGAKTFEYRYAQEQELNELQLRRAGYYNNTTILQATGYEFSVYPLSKPNLYYSKSDNDIQLKWETVEGAHVYEIDMALDGQPYLLSDTVEVTSLKTAISSYSTLKYRVRAKRTDGDIVSYSAYSEIEIPRTQNTGVVRIVSFYEELGRTIPDDSYYFQGAFQLGTPEGKEIVLNNSYYDYTSEQIRKTIKSNLTNCASENDVSVLYFSCHGESNLWTTSMAGELSIKDSEPLKLSVLADWIEEIPGKKVIIFASCGSGAAIGDTYVDDVFRYFVTLITDHFAPFRKDNFYVICGAKGGTNANHTGLSDKNGIEYGFHEISKYIYHTAKFGDSDADGIIKLKELETYIAHLANEHFLSTWEDGDDFYSGRYTAVWPKESDFNIFVLKKH